MKAMALAALFVRCGLHVAAAPGARVDLFDAIHADIGDEQDIRESLSTFSAHMANLGSILASADARSLVVLDEVGVDGFNTNLLAERAGVRVRTVYRYFPNKGALLAAVNAEVVAEFQAVAAQEEALRAEWQEKLVQQDVREAEIVDLQKNLKLAEAEQFKTTERAKSLKEHYANTLRISPHT